MKTRQRTKTCVHLRPSVANVVSFILITLFLPAFTAPAQTTEQNTYARFLNIGIEQMKAADYQGAINSFEQARRYNDSAAAAHLGLGIAYFHLHEEQYAESELKRALEINPREATAYQFLGELYYRKDDLDSAVSYWEKAVELDPSASGLRARLERVRREHQTEKDFNRDVTRLDGLSSGYLKTPTAKLAALCRTILTEKYR
jgi:tetratricopeptide (TPR) repeat protein